MGERVCTSGEWGPCVGDSIVQLPAPAPGQQAQALGNSQACIDNPCDPFCQVVVDDSENLMVTGNLTAGDDGLTLKAVPPQNNGTPCTGITVAPAAQTVTVTAINAS